MKHESHNRSIEVELSAGELSELARPADDEMSRAALNGFMGPTQSAQSVQSVQSVQSAQEMPAPTKLAAKHSSAASMHRFSSARAVGILASIIVAGIAVAAHFEYSEAKKAVEPAVAWTPLPEKPDKPEVIEVEEPAPPPPTRYVNPFDRSEVFELPPGLTKEEAREMVAQLLIERAKERAARK